MDGSPAAEIGAFCAHDPIRLEGAGDGPLLGLTFAAKDIFDIAGRVACCGNPDWLRTHAPAAETAPAIRRLLDAGASLAGMTLTEELVMGLTGENPHYGTPVNVAAPGRVAGGSSSGSAAAVAAGLVDFALGSDTGGSVRVPASFCGLYGLRPTHGRIPLDGVMPFAPSLDTVGWFARSAEMMRRVGAVLLDRSTERTPARATRLLVAADAFFVLGDDIRDALAPAVDRIAGILGPAEEIAIAGEASLADWSRLIATYREYEGWRTHREWIGRFNPTLSENGAMRMKRGAAYSDADLEAADAARQKVRARIAGLLSGGAVIVLPAAPGVAPPRGRTPEQNWQIVGRNGLINAAASLTGVPQISLPWARVDGVPMGLGVMAARGADETLLDLACAAAPD